MKPTRTIFIGQPLSGAEARFLRRLYSDLADTDAIILANFIAGERQIDFVVITGDHAAILELKNFPLPVFGEKNGRWSFEDSAGQRIRYAGLNPYQQSLEQKYALSDEMKRYAADDPLVPRASGNNFYSDFDAFVCIFPAIHERSQVTRGDRKVLIRSYGEVLEQLRDRGKASSWTLDDWARFAQQHLKLERATLEEAGDRKIVDATENLRSYCGRVRSLFGTQLPPLIRTTDEASCGTALIGKALERQNCLFLGPSGTAKTFHAHHLVLALLESEDELPIFVEARAHHAGDFKIALRKSVAPLCTGDANELLNAMLLCGLTPVLVVDALNECDERYQHDFVKGIQAFKMQFGGRVVLTTQTTVTLPGELKSSVFQLPLPNLEQKRLIYAHHAELPASPDLDALCAGFSNAYELTLAGRCHHSGPAPETRVELYDRYVRRSLPRHTAVATALLRELAGEMATHFATYCDRETFESTAERFLREHGAPITVLDEVCSSRLVRLSHEGFSFEHELLLAYFRAEALRKQSNETSQLLEELHRPRNRDLVNLILPRFKDGTDIATLLRAATDARLLTHALAGDSGALVRSVLLEECKTLLRNASEDLPAIRLEIQPFHRENGAVGLKHVAVSGDHMWIAYDALLCSVIGSSLHIVDLRDAFLQLLDQTEWTMRASVRKASAASGFRSKRIWEETVRLYGGIIQHGTMALPCTSILSTLRNILMHREQSLDAGLRSAFFERAHRQPASEFSLLMLLEDRANASRSDLVNENLDLIEHALATDIYILQVTALEYLQLMASTICETVPDALPRAKQLLESTDTNNIFINTLVVETLTSFDALPQPVTDEAAEDEMRAVIALRADDQRVVEISEESGVSAAQTLASLAYGSLARIFEDIFQSAYFRAYQTLDRDDKEAILILGATSDDVGFVTDWILEELLKHGGKRALPVYRGFATGIDTSNCFGQDAVSAFVLGIKGCARFSEDPPAYTKGDSPQHQAWKLVGEILFHVFRGKTGSDLAPFWDKFEGEVRYATADVLFRLASTYRVATEDRMALDLVASCANELRLIIEECVHGRDSLPSILPYGGSSDPAVVLFLIRSLGRIADPRSLHVLRAAADDPKFGAHAIEAMHAIEKAAVRDRGRDLPIPSR